MVILAYAKEYIAHDILLNMFKVLDKSLAI